MLLKKLLEQNIKKAHVYKVINTKTTI